MPYERLDLPLHAGLSGKIDEKALDAPGLAVARDIQFDDLGGIQTRDQYQEILSAAGNTISDIRKISAYGDELVAFSKDKLWSYASGDGLWTERAEHLAVAVEENARFVTTGEQYDCDRAELNGVIFYCWSETNPSGSDSYIAAIDKATGAVKLSPELIVSSGTAERPKLIATSNRIVCIYHKQSPERLVTRTFDPTDMSETGGAIVTSGLVAFDAMQDPDSPADVVILATFGSVYNLMRSSAGAAPTVIVARTTTTGNVCALAFNQDTSEWLICYHSGTAIEADIRTYSGGFAVNDIAVGTATSSTVNQIAAIHDGTEFRVFYTASETTSGSNAWATEQNTVSNAGTPGTETDLIAKCSIASRAFLHEGSVFLWVAFAGASSGEVIAQLQNTYFLYRADGLLIAKAVPTQGGGFASKGYLPNVQTLSSNQYAFCAQYRRIIALGDTDKGYEAKSPQDVIFEFDSNDARRTARLGETLYISGGQLSQYDGRNIAEVGFHIFPWSLSIVPTTGSNLDGTYNWQQTNSWFNARGEFERSTTASIYGQTMAGHQASIIGENLHVTLKTGDAGEVASEFWRQVDGATFGAPFHLVTSKDPASTGDNKYVANAPGTGVMATFNDDLADANLLKREPNPENGGLTLENLAPPSASIIVATQDRLILAGIPGNPYKIAYSKLRGPGEIAAFNDFLSLDLPPEGGDITALAFINETLIAFKETAIYAVSGEGYDNNGTGQNYGPGRLLSSDVGAVSQEGVVLTPKGLLFKSSKGWYIVNHGWGVSYVGADVADFDSDTITACHVMESQHQVRCVSASRTLIWDYLSDVWAEWPIGSTSACIWDGEHHLVNADADGILVQSNSHAGSGEDLPRLDIESAWIKLSNLQGYSLARYLYLLGEYLGEHDLRIRVAYDYIDTWVEDKTWTVSPATAGTLQLEHGFARPKCQSFKIRITAQAVGSTDAPITKALNLTGLSLEFKLKGTSYKGLPSAQKQ